MTFAPIALDYPLSCTVERAFETYVHQIGQWWPGAYTINASTFAGVTIEGKVGGRIFATHRVEGEVEWGQVVLWDPPHRLVHTFGLGLPPGLYSEIDISLTARAPGCRLHFVHGGWGPETAAYRQKFRDWQIILDRFAAVAEAS